jgi:hypothetical protein
VEDKMIHKGKGKSMKLKIRRVWSINPRTRIKGSKKKYDKKLTKKELEDILKKEDF